MVSKSLGVQGKSLVQSVLLAGLSDLPEAHRPWDPQAAPLRSMLACPMS